MDRCIFFGIQASSWMTQGKAIKNLKAVDLSARISNKELWAEFPVWLLTT
jgi:hypothetical protein